MKIIDSLKERIERSRIKKKYLLPAQKYNYTDEVNRIKENIINSIPNNFTQIEKAYYIYLELGKILYEDPINAFGKDREKEELSKRIIDSDLHGNCKAIAELYVSILNDRRVGIKSELLTINKNNGAHVDSILHIDGKQYIANLISDLSRIKTNKRVNSFGFNLFGVPNIQYTENYKKMVNRYYKNLAFLTREEIEQLDKKLGYSYYPKTEKETENRGIYTEDVFGRIKQELEDPETFKKYILKGRDDLKPDEILKYKLQFFFENMHNFSTYNGDMRYLENIRYYFYTLKKFFTQEEAKRINVYACTENNDLSKIYSIIKLKGEKPEENTYFIYDETKKMYIEIDKKDLAKVISEKKNFKIIGEIDQKRHIEKEELEL